VVDADARANIPAAQLAHAPDVVAAVEAEKVPAAHATQSALLTAAA
jgi:hypothetical protein